MVRVLERNDIFGRIGQGIGQGAGGAFKERAEKGILASGLKELSKKKGLSPFETFTGLASIPGVTPQVIQSGSELLRTQAIRDSLRGPSTGNFPQQNEETSGDSSTSGFPDTSGFQNNADKRLPDFKNTQKDLGTSEKIPTGFSNRGAEASAKKGLVTENPAQEKFLPKIRWTPEQKENDIFREMERSPYLSFQEAKERSDLNEQRYLSSPGDYQKRQDYLREQEDKADTDFDNQLRTLLQKGKDEPLYGENSGVLINNAKKAMYNDLANDPSLTPRTVAEKWSKKLFDLANQDQILKEKAGRDIYDKLRPGKKEETLKSLNSAQKLYEELGQQREFYNKLRSDFDLTPGYASLISYPRSEPLKDLIRSSKIGEKSFDKIAASSRKVAEEFSKKRSLNDSILAFARSMKDKDRYFDENAFFDYLRENQSSLNFTPDQKKELVQGVSDIFPNWGDLALFPITGRSVLHE